MKDYEVGEEFQFGRIKLRVEKCDNPIDCENCFFEDTVCINHIAIIGECDGEGRVDGTSVKFVKVEEDEN